MKRLNQTESPIYTTLFQMKRLNQTESPIFVILCDFCFQRQSFLTFINRFKRAMKLSTMIRLTSKHAVWRIATSLSSPFILMSVAFNCSEKESDIY